MEYRIYIERIEVKDGITSKVGYETLLTKEKFDKIYNVLKNGDN